MRYFYGASDEKFVKSKKPHKKREPVNPLQTYRFRLHPILKYKRTYNQHDLPILFRASPNSLITLAAIVLNSMPLCSVYEWTTEQVCRWIREYGYPQYQRTFRENYVTGRKMLLVDVNALSVMNIKNFEHMKHIAYGIRCLFDYEMVRFGRSISLPPEDLNQLFKLFRTNTGGTYDRLRRIDLWRRWNLIHSGKENALHWEQLDRTLRLETGPKYSAVVGHNHRKQLYRCNLIAQDTGPPPARPIKCRCQPPCECYWPETDVQPPRVLSCLDPRPPDPDFKGICLHCAPPCMCKWSSDKFMIADVLTVLHETFPYKYQKNDLRRESTKNVLDIRRESYKS